MKKFQISILAFFNNFYYSLIKDFIVNNKLKKSVRIPLE